jgi:hypothetical protein
MVRVSLQPFLNSVLYNFRTGPKLNRCGNKFLGQLTEQFIPGQLKFFW